MSEPVQQRTGESLAGKDLGPFLKGQVGGQHEAVMLVGPADNLKKQFGSGLGEGNISEFINHQQMEFLELFVQALKSLFFPGLHELSDGFESEQVRQYIRAQEEVDRSKGQFRN